VIRLPLRAMEARVFPIAALSGLYEFSFSYAYPSGINDRFKVNVH
jgi:hypothetical protein